MHVNEKGVHGYCVEDVVKVDCVDTEPKALVPISVTVITWAALNRLRVAAMNETVYVRAKRVNGALVRLKLLVCPQ